MGTYILFQSLVTSYRLDSRYNLAPAEQRDRPLPQITWLCYLPLRTNQHNTMCLQRILDGLYLLVFLFAFYASFMSTSCYTKPDAGSPTPLEFLSQMQAIVDRFSHWSYSHPHGNKCTEVMQVTTNVFDQDLSYHYIYIYIYYTFMERLKKNNANSPELIKKKKTSESYWRLF